MPTDLKRINKWNRHVSYQSQKILFTISLLLILSSSPVSADPESVQLVGNFEGITCEPDDPANNMEQLGGHLWRKLKFINEPGDPDTIFFKFTQDGSYMPMHWGWSGTWGIAKYDYNPANIAAVLPDSGYHYIHFNDSSYNYWIDRPGGKIDGVIRAEGHDLAPDGTTTILFDSIGSIIGTHSDFDDSTFSFEGLPPSTYSITALAPGYGDTTISGVELGVDEIKWLAIRLTPISASFTVSASYTRSANVVHLSWTVYGYRSGTGFDLFRGVTPITEAAEKINGGAIRSARLYEYTDVLDDDDISVDLYYYIVESGGDEPRWHGPVFVEGMAPGISSRLDPNYPNPFNPSTTIPFTVGARNDNNSVRIEFYDVAGRLVDRHILGTKSAGDHTFRWNPGLSGRDCLPTGVYYCRLTIGKDSFTRKLILLR